MKTITQEQYYADADMRLHMLEVAHRERARAIRAGFDWLRDRLTPRIHIRPARWIARLG